MAQTTQEIFDAMKAQAISLATDAQRDDYVEMFNNTSRVAMWKMIFWAVAYSIRVVQQIFDLFRIEQDDKISRQKTSRQAWYVEKSKAFQYGFNLVSEADYYDNTGLTDDQISASLIVSFAAAVETDNGVLIKVARIVNGDLAALSAPQLIAFTEYIKRIKPAGVKITVSSGQADDLQAKLRVYYNPLVLAADGSRIDGTNSTPVQSELSYYLKNSIPFNGLFVPMLAVDALQKVDGVVIVKDEYWQARYGVLPFTGIDYEYNPDSGYLRIANDALTIQFIPHSEI